MSQLTILYVEDDLPSQNIMYWLVNSQENPIHLVTFSDSVSLIERVMALQPQPDLIFLDIHVSPYNGFQMLTMLRQYPQWDHIPIVALTASVMNEEVQQLQTAGFNGCLAKPLNIDTFPEVIAQILNGEELWNIY